MKEVKIAFEDPDSRLFEINRLGSNEAQQKLTKEEFKKLELLMPEVNWIVIQWVKP